MAAVLACGPGAVLSHRTAAALWGLRSSAGAIHVTAPSRSGRERRRGIVLHRALLDASEITETDGLPVTTPARTLLDLAATVAPRVLAHAVEAAERNRLFDLNAIDESLARYPGRAGSRVLRAAVEQHRPASELTRNALERRFLDLCAEANLDEPQVNAPVGDYVVDFLWPGQKLVVETDGGETHMTRAAFERDRVRDAELTVSGYRVVRFTYRRIVERPGELAQTLRALLPG